jgi:aspartate racemase
MKTMGIIGGIAPASTIEYYRFIIDSYRKQKNDGTYPNIIINSIDMTKMLNLISADKLKEVTEYIAYEVQKSSNAGADFAILASNTPHIVFNEVQKLSQIPLISIVESARDAAVSIGLKKVGLFGTRSTMKAKFYPDIFSNQGIKVVVPDTEDQEYIHSKYMNELINGIFLQETKEKLLAIVEKLKKKESIRGLILGGTELPIILRDSADCGIPFLDTTKIHVEKAVERMLT